MIRGFALEGISQGSLAQEHTQDSFTQMSYPLKSLTVVMATGRTEW